MPNLFEFAFTAAKIVVTGVVDALKDIVDKISQTIRDKGPAGELEAITQARAEKERAHEELKEVNNELISIQEKVLRRKNLSETENERLEFLMLRRSKLQLIINRTVETIRGVEIIQDRGVKIVSASRRIHIIERSIGTYVPGGKKCPKCGRGITLTSFSQPIDGEEVKNFYWVCSGWYDYRLPDGNRACNFAIKLSLSGLKIYAPTDSPELQMDDREYESLVMEPILIEQIYERVKDVSTRHPRVKDYICPTHGEELELWSKRQKVPLFEGQFVLICPRSRWKKPNNQRCGYMVALKSAGQISNMLTAVGEGGIFYK